MAPVIGEAVKVWLPGETPWAECIAINQDGSWLGRLDNDLVCTGKHGLRLNDVVRFVGFPDAPRAPWTPEQFAASP